MNSLEEIFVSIGVAAPQSNNTNWNKPVSVLEFPCVHSNDSEPVTVIWPDLERGPWIAGGACLKWYQNQPVGESDIDIFCTGPAQAERVIESIKSYGRYSNKYESDNAVTLDYSSKDSTMHWTLQVIKRRYFNSLQDVINNFDISVCQIGTAGNDWLLGKNTAADIRLRQLRMNLPLAPDAAKRMIKYWTYGYRPVEGLVDAVINNPLGKKEFNLNEDYENAF